jgi:hypothetical protein
MANTITKTHLLNGPLNLVTHVTIVGDGSGEESAAILIDRSTFAPDGTKLILDKVTGHLTAFSARLLWDATADLEICQMPADQWFFYDWCGVGGFPSGKAGAGGTGDLLITTASLGNGDRGTFTLYMRKKAS